MAHKAVVAYISFFDNKLAQKLVECETKTAKEAHLAYELANYTGTATKYLRETNYQMFEGHEEDDMVHNDVAAKFFDCDSQFSVIWIEDIVT